jgi:hypothetical protein
VGLCWCSVRLLLCWLETTTVMRLWSAIWIRLSCIASVVILADGPIWSAGLDAGVQIRYWALCRSRETIHGTSLVVSTGETFLKHTVIVSHDGGEFGMEIE